MHDHGGGGWDAVVDEYLASTRGADTSAYAQGQLRHQDGVALGFEPGRHGLDNVHELRLFLEGLAPPKALAPLTDCRPFCSATMNHELAHWLMTAGTRSS